MFTEIGGVEPELPGHGRQQPLAVLGVHVDPSVVGPAERRGATDEILAVHRRMIGQWCPNRQDNGGESQA